MLLCVCVCVFGCDGPPLLLGHFSLAESGATLRVWCVGL